jgi:hypothetical protein
MVPTHDSAAEEAWRMVGKPMGMQEMTDVRFKWKTKNEPVGRTFEVRGNWRLADGVKMPQPTPDGWYWSYHDPTSYGEAHGPFDDEFTAADSMAAWLKLVHTR